MSKKNKEYNADKFEITPEIEGFLREKEFNKKYQKQQTTGIIDPDLKKPNIEKVNYFDGKDEIEIPEGLTEKISAHLKDAGNKKSADKKMINRFKNGGI